MSNSDVHMKKYYNTYEQLHYWLTSILLFYTRILSIIMNVNQSRLDLTQSGLG